MKARSRCSLLLLVTVLGAAGVVASAQAQTISPDDSDVLFVAQDPTFGGVTCETGTLEGRTGIDEDYLNLELEFSGCSFGGMGVTLECSHASGPENEFGTARLRALVATTNNGEVDRFNEDFLCFVAVPGICTLSVAEQELPISGGVNAADLLDEGGSNADLDVQVDMLVTRTGSPLCGPMTGVSTWAGFYQADPSFRFDP